VKFDYIFSSFLCIRRGAILVTMYNFGSPRVGNKKFAELYNEVIKIDIIFKFFSQFFSFSLNFTLWLHCLCRDDAASLRSKNAFSFTPEVQ
jgi:hypothetical protein